MADLDAFLERRAGKAAKAILTAKEQLVDPHVPDEAAAALRKVILEQVNDLKEQAVTLLRALDDGRRVINEQWLDVLDQIDAIHRAVTAGEAPVPHVPTAPEPPPPEPPQPNRRTLDLLESSRWT